MRSLLIATTNRDKLREIQRLLADVPIEIVALDPAAGIEAPEETGRTFEENARAKALYYAALGPTPDDLTLAEDSGLEIDALGGAPGVASARYGGADAPYSRKFDLIYEALGGVPDAKRTARFVCAMALVRGSEVLCETRGTVEGRIAAKPAGHGGFGYDPIFFYPPYGRTLAEVSEEDKLAVAHRGEAVRALRPFLQTLQETLQNSASARQRRS